MPRLHEIAILLIVAVSCSQRMSTPTLGQSPPPHPEAEPLPAQSTVRVTEPLVPPPAMVEPHYDGPWSSELRNPKLRSPMPGGFLGGWGGDTGLDIAGNHLDVFALAAGTLDYSEWGHTLWTRGRDTPFSVRLALDEPIPWKNGRRITHVYYTHLSSVATTQPEGTPTPKHVDAGERIGVSGIGNGVPHLHLGLLLDGQVEQDSWEFILREDEIRDVMGGYKNGVLLKGGTSSSLRKPPRR